MVILHQYLSAKRFRRFVGVVVALMIVFAFSMIVMAASPPSGNPPGPSIYSYEDCHGAGVQTDTAEVNPCQSYNKDLYETLDTTQTAFACTDIEFFRVYQDVTFVYVEFDFDGLFTNTNCGSQVFAIELDNDADTEGPNAIDQRFDYFIGGNSNSCRTSSATDWVAYGSISSAAFYEDTDDDAGGDDPRTADNCTATDCIDNNGDYNDTDRASDGPGTIFCRIDESGGAGTSDKLYVALEKEYFDIGDVTSDGDVRIRLWSDTSSSISKDKLHWHDNNTSSDLDKSFDNTGTAEWDTTAVTLTGIKATSSTRTAYLAAAVLILIVLLGASILITRRRSPSVE
jgi:hypothetical protein